MRFSTLCFGPERRHGEQNMQEQGLPLSLYARVE